MILGRALISQGDQGTLWCSCRMKMFFQFVNLSLLQDETFLLKIGFLGITFYRDNKC